MRSGAGNGSRRTGRPRKDRGGAGRLALLRRRIRPLAPAAGSAHLGSARGNLNVHRQADKQALASAGWPRICHPPPYAPDLNPAEGIWPALTRTALASLAAAGLDHLAAVIRHGLKSFQYRPGLISGCLTGTGLRLHGQAVPGTASPQAPGARNPAPIPVPP